MNAWREQMDRRIMSMSHLQAHTMQGIVHLSFSQLLELSHRIPNSGFRGRMLSMRGGKSNPLLRGC